MTFITTTGLFEKEKMQIVEILHRLQESDGDLRAIPVDVYREIESVLKSEDLEEFIYAVVDTLEEEAAEAEGEETNA